MSFRLEDNMNRIDRDGVLRNEIFLLMTDTLCRAYLEVYGKIRRPEIRKHEYRRKQANTDTICPRIMDMMAYCRRP